MSQTGPTGRFEIYIDGSSRGNPGPAACGVVIRDAEGLTLLEEGYQLGEMTNNAAEYHGLLIALEQALLLGAKAVRVRADSELLVRQINGEYRVKHPDLKVLFGRAGQLIRKFADFSIEHIMREENAEADKLAQRASREARAATKKAGAPNPAGPGQKKLF